ncbi:zinc finger protein weckle isoform X1 [Ceratitis capitata]|uniref:zinc finger protein weckle isoform X1 n=1 Tax=Ceratitis capitata TaxID=7213 RepID=UPI000618917D|nr:zinc finger protein weckle isoform X1 [Ceratitis capitata]
MEDWQNWCRLCAKTDAQYINALSGECVPTMTSVGAYTSMSIASNIAEFFQVHIKEDEKLSTWICRKCWEMVQSFVEFKEKIKKVQNLYNDLLDSEDKTKLDLKALFENYGLLEEEYLTAEEHSKLPVEEIYIAVSNVKNESASNTLCTETPIKECDIASDFKDPIGEEKTQPVRDNLFPDEENDTCSAQEVDAMEVDTSEEDDDNVKSVNKINNENNSFGDVENITKVSKYVCNICAQRFQRSGNYAAHMIKKHDKIICPDCPGSFENEASLKEHMKNHRRLFPCKHCERKFQRKEYVEQHIKFVHKDERPFICEACGDAVRTKGQLKEHMLTHTDYSPFECKECGKCFKQKQRLKRHMQIHGEKHICNECGKQLSCRATYNSHMLVHSDKMHHKCDYCGREFKRAKTLKSHLILHSGLKPYSCEFCDRIFTNGSNCRTHMKRTHPKELAELEASGEKTYTKNIPELAVLKSVIRGAKNLVPVVSKESGNFAFGKKTKTKLEGHVDAKQTELKL